MKNWLNPKNWFDKEDLKEKLNPAQEVIAWQEGSFIGTNAQRAYLTAFEKLESVNRGVSMIANACASLDYDILDKKLEGTIPGMRVKQINQLLNTRPNPYESVQEFRVKLFTDFLLEGNFFIYYDGVYLYHLPAIQVVVEPDPKTFIKGYTYNRNIQFSPDEIIHVKDINSHSVYRGTSRLEAADRNIKTLFKMQDFQTAFFENGAVPGMVLITDNTLSQTAKDKSVLNWMQKYSPKTGARKPVILDGGLKPHSLNEVSFKELDFDSSISNHNIRILETLGIPPVLLDGGNQANIAPNLRLFYLETVMPILRKFVSAMELFTGYDIDVIIANVSALQPDIRDIATYHTTLVNGGVLTPNEARVELRYPKDSDPSSDKLRIPANIAGSAANPSLGGAPKQPVTGEPKVPPVKN